jgi:hypothetical protein
MEKKKISNSEELNNYYKLVHTKLKKFTDLDIPKNKLVKYLKPNSTNFKKFIENDAELKDIDNIELILKDILDDTYAVYKDNLSKNKSIKKFESFTKDIFDIQTSKEDEIEHEKALADIFSISISYIDLINSKIHLYAIDNNGDLIQSIIFSEKELFSIKDKMVKELCEDLKKRNIKLIYNKEILLDDLIDQLEIYNVISDDITLDDVIKTIIEYNGLKAKVSFYNSYVFESEKFYIFDVIYQDQQDHDI